MKSFLFFRPDSLAQSLQQCIHPYHIKIKSTSFIVKLGTGHLTQFSFRDYLQRDIAYLRGYEACLTRAAANPCHKHLHELLSTMARSAQDEVAFYHRHWGNEITMHTLSHQDVCHAYLQHLDNLSYGKDVMPLLCAVLPCMTIYKELGKHFEQKYCNHTDPDIDRWVRHIMRFSQKEFDPLLQQLTQAIDTSLWGCNQAGYRAQLWRVCLRSAQYELDFFNSIAMPKVYLASESRLV